MYRKNPIRHSHVLNEEADSEMLLCTEQSGGIHVLNATATLIWSLCDGEHSVEEIAQSLEHYFVVPEGYDPIPDVCRTLDTLEAKGLLQPP